MNVADMMFIDLDFPLTALFTVRFAKETVCDTTITPRIHRGLSLKTDKEEVNRYKLQSVWEEENQKMATTRRNKNIKSFNEKLFILRSLTQAWKSGGDFFSTT
jgi:hypothetical protein